MTVSESIDRIHEIERILQGLDKTASDWQSEARKYSMEKEELKYNLPRLYYAKTLLPYGQIMLTGNEAECVNYAQQHGYVVGHWTPLNDEFFEAF